MPAVTDREASDPSGSVEAARGIPERHAACKAALDFVVGAALLVLTAPLMLAAMLVVKLTSRGPAIYAQTRVGRGGKPYTIYKIRSMAHDCERHTGARWSVPGDPRVTPVGRLLRRTHLDELPQLWNVLRGEMSLVGPRPERPEFVEQLSRAIPGYRLRLSVRPGLTGLAQIQLPPDTDLASVRRKLAYDLYYLKTSSPWLDLKILLGTVLYAAGVPGWATTRTFQIPDARVVESAGDDRPDSPHTVPQVQASYANL